MDNFGLSELYSVVLKTTYPIEINGVKIESGEVVAAFEKIQLANFNEIKNRATAHGGYLDAPRIFWEDTKEIQISFTQGVFSKTQYALMANAKLIEAGAKKTIEISKRERLESDENGKIYLSESPVGKIFIYNVEGKKITFTDVDKKTYDIGEPFQDVVVDYTYNYKNKVTTMVVGQRLINGFLTLEGKTRVKDDTTGQTRTGIIKIPKLKLMSDLSMRLGENATPLVGRLNAVAVPSGTRGNPVVMELVFLEDDIDSDM